MKYSYCGGDGCRTMNESHQLAAQLWDILNPERVAASAT